MVNCLEQLTLTILETEEETNTIIASPPTIPSQLAPIQSNQHEPEYKHHKQGATIATTDRDGIRSTISTAMLASS